MKKLLVLAGLALALALAGPLAGSARAEQLDFSKITCGDFLEFDEDEVGMLYFWLDGYLSAKSGNTKMDTNTVESDLKELQKTCRANKGSTILSLF